MGEKKKGVAFFEAGSWYHRIKILREDGTTGYSKKGGFATAEEAEKSYRKYEEDFARACRKRHAAASSDFGLKDYLIYWLDEIFTPRIENTTRMLASYVLYDLLIPSMGQEIKLRHVSAEYLDALLAEVAKTCESAGNKCRELLNMALKDAVIHGYIPNNPVPSTKPYKRKKASVTVLNKDGIRIFLQKASESGWYLEILLGLFLGLRKGEIAGLKYGDFDFSRGTVTVSRQVTGNPVVPKGQKKICEYQVVEKQPKTPNSYRTLWVPDAVMEEVDKRRMQRDEKKKKLGDAYIDKDYVSCQENGLPHAASSFNTALTKICQRAGLPHLTVHSLRHMYASILTEQGVSMNKVSALLGHASMNTTFEYYCEVMDETEKIRGFLNNNFIPGGD